MYQVFVDLQTSDDFILGEYKDKDGAYEAVLLAFKQGFVEYNSTTGSSIYPLSSVERFIIRPSTKNVLN